MLAVIAVVCGSSFNQQAASCCTFACCQIEYTDPVGRLASATKQSLSLLLLLLCMLATGIDCAKYLKEKPDFLTPCNLADANLNKCLAANVQGIFVQWKDGLPGKNSIGSFDPLLLKRVKIEQDASSTIAINADMKDVHVTGASKLIIKDANYNADKYVIKAVAFVPKLRFEFDYKLKGHVLALNLDGQGKGSFEADKMLMLLEMGVKPRNTPEANFADVQYFKVGFKDIGNFHIQLHNLIAGNPELEKSAHTLINENWRQFYEVLKPAIEQTIEAVLLDRSTKILNYVPATYIIDNFH